MPKLKVLYFKQENIDKSIIQIQNFQSQMIVYKKFLLDTEVVDSLVELYPNLEFLQMNNYGYKSEILEERECLSAIRFQNLTSLHLYGSFELDDGAFLLPVFIVCS